MKKKKILCYLLAFIFVFNLFTITNLKVNYITAKANAVTNSLSLLMLSMYASNVAYYGNGSTSQLMGDVNSFAAEKNINAGEWLNGFQSVIIDVPKKVVKFTQMQIYAMKEFISYLRSKGKVSADTLTSEDFTYVKAGNATRAYLWNNGGGVGFSDEHFSTSINLTVPSAYEGNVFVCIAPDSVQLGSGNHAVNEPFQSSQLGFDYGCYSTVYIVLTEAPSNLANSFSYTCTVHNLENDNITTRTVTPSFYQYNDVYMSHVSPVNSSYNGGQLRVVFPYNAIKELYSVGDGYTVYGYPPAVYDSALGAYNALKGYVDIFSNDPIILPDYANIAGSVALPDEDTSVYCPDIINIASNIAINDGRYDVTVDDLTQAIDDTLIGTKVKEDDEDKPYVYTPDIPIDILDDAVSDTVVEDTEVTPPEPTLPDFTEFELAHKFPFSMLFDYLFILNIFDSTPIAPRFDIGFDALGSQYRYTVDLSDFNSVARIARTMELLAFIAGLSIFTIQYIKGDN